MIETREEYLKRVRCNIDQINGEIEQLIFLPEFKEIYFNVTEYIIEFSYYLEKTEYSAEDCNSILLALVARVKTVIDKKYVKELSLASSDELWKDDIDYDSAKKGKITKEMLLNNLKHVEERRHITTLNGDITLLEAKLVQIMIMNNPRIAEFKEKLINTNFEKSQESNSHNEHIENDITFEEIEKYGCSKEDARLLEEFMQEEYPEFDELLGRTKDNDEKTKVIIQTVIKEIENPNRRGIFGFPKFGEPKKLLIKEEKKV